MPAFQSLDLNSTGLSDQTPAVFYQWPEYQVVFIVIFLVVLLIVSSISKGSIIYYICVYAPPRPINRMMLIDQICQLFTSSIIGSMTIVSLIRRTPLIEDVGAISCWLYWAAIIIHNSSVILGGLGMAAFRLLCIKYTYTTVAQVWSLLKKILWYEGLTASLIVVLSMSLGYQLDPNTPVVLCRGYSIQMREIIRDYENSDDSDRYISHVSIAIVIMLGLVMPCVELGMYVYLYQHLSDNDRKIEERGGLPKEEIFRRRKRNILTLYGQSFAFCIEAGFGFFFFMIQTRHNMDEFFMEPILVLVISTVISVAQFWSSPDLKRFYFPNMPSIRLIPTSLVQSMATLTSRAPGAETTVISAPPMIPMAWIPESNPAPNDDGGIAESSV